MDTNYASQKRKKKKRNANISASVIYHTTHGESTRDYFVFPLLLISIICVCIHHPEPINCVRRPIDRLIIDGCAKRKGRTHVPITGKERIEILARKPSAENIDLSLGGKAWNKQTHK